METQKHDTWYIVDSDGIVINHLHYNKNDKPTNPHPCYPTYQMILGTGIEKIGWTYNEKTGFTPPKEYPLIGEDPVLVKKVDPKDKQIEDLKADVQTLSASLTQVINTLNNITRPTSATKNNPAK